MVDKILRKRYPNIKIFILFYFFTLVQLWMIFLFIWPLNTALFDIHMYVVTNTYNM